MIQTLRLYCYLDFIETYPNLWTAIGDIFSIFANLLIYWYTAKAFGSHFNGDYFSYILIGDVALMIPTALFSGTGTRIKESIVDGTFEAYLLSPTKTQFIYVLSSLRVLPREIARICTQLLMASLFFGFKFSIFFWICVAGLEFLAIPLFLGAGLLGASMLLVFGRGMLFLSQISLFLTILAGVYFPVEVFPTAIQQFASWTSPFSLLLLSIRRIFAGDTSALTSTSLLILLWVGLIVPLSFWSFGLALNEVKRRGRPLLLS